MAAGVAHNLGLVRARLAGALAAAGRDTLSVSLLAVSKHHPAAAIREAYAAGQRDFGENYAQELARKADELRDLSELRWHMIGHLQRNKVKLVVPHAVRVSSVDSERLLRELSAQRSASPISLNETAGNRTGLEVLLEVKLGDELSKSGAPPAAVPALVELAERLPGLELRGLMLIPPHGVDPAPYFAELVALHDSLGGAQRLPVLSMGMSGDLEAAVLAGSTEVRVGTAIFGERA
jgi:pyridoxal phosphate enzyme (YggS family)